MHLPRTVLVLVVLSTSIGLLSVISACTAGQDLARRPSPSGTDAASDAEVAARIVDFALPPPGITDRGRAAGLVLVEIGVGIRCTAALIASNVAIAPARCVARARCDALPPEALAIRSSDEGRELLGAVLEVVGPSTSNFCDEEALAALVLSSQSDGLAPLPIRSRPAAVGEFVRFVGVSREASQRTLRDHLRVERTTRRELGMAGDPCATWAGAVSLDEATGELLGIARSPRDGCDEPREMVDFVQLDAVRALVATALAHAAAPRIDEDGGVIDAGRPRRGTVSRPTLDLGEPCESAINCAAGVCVVEPGAGGGYCSRTCGPGDRCPLGLRCEHTDVGRSACVRSP